MTTINSLAGSHLADHEVRGRRDFLGQALFLLNLVGIKL